MIQEREREREGERGLEAIEWTNEMDQSWRKSGIGSSTMYT